MQQDFDGRFDQQEKPICEHTYMEQELSQCPEKRSWALIE